MRTLSFSFFLFLLVTTALQGANRPNIILMMADDMGWGDTGFNGNEIIQTPHLDEMAKAGLKLNRFYSAAPVCSPTRGSCMTGRHPYRYGIYSANTGHMKTEELTLPELLKKKGYTTGHFGKWHMGTLTKTLKDANRGGPKGAGHFSPPQDNGFEICFSTESKTPTYDPMIKPIKASGKVWDYLTDKSKSAPYGTYYWDEKGQMVTDNLEGDDSRVIMDRAIPFIEKATRAKKPFFTVIWFHAPHLPVVAGPKHVKPYAEYPSYERNYYGCITALDEQVGRLRASLKQLGIANNTMVWFGSDNGPEGKAKSAPGTAGPFRGRKRDLYEGGVRVPALVEWPAVVKAGTTTSIPAVTSDYLPTILEIVGAEKAESRPLDGVSLVSLLKGQMKQRSEPIGFQSKNLLALSDNRFKLYSGDKGKTWELYDLLRNPAEDKDIAEKHPDVVVRMKKVLAEWRASCVRSDQGGDY
ncbi:sulfatase-like hydrolase/transferase [Verrucomicrobia bacterium]|nr:sulfatase-like hydrolase/transferase [Verrucomicrobiota bacterium]